MSGAKRDAGCTRNLLIVSNLSSSLGQRWSATNVKANFLVQETVFLTDNKPSFWIVLRNQEPEFPSILGDIENEIRRVGLPWPERLCEWCGDAARAGKSCLTFRRWREASPGVVYKYDLATVGCERSVPAVRRDSALVKPSLYSNNDKFSARSDLLHLRAESGGRLRADEGIGKVAIDLAKILPPAGR